ncbi:MAG TPA: APC family permease, partial [Puia sp.]|nr:APC family permease [Puia sp.]
TVLELNSLMPVEGGYYEWVKKGLGLRWAFYEGWWTWLYTFVDLAIYPVFFVEYAAFFWPGIEHYKIPVSLALIWLNAGLNIRGIVPVGRSAMVLTVLVMVPFFALLLCGVFHGHTAAASATVAHAPGFTSISLALYTIMWNYIGWDNATTYAGEVERPVRAYLVATLLAFAAVYLIYTSATWLAQSAGLNSQTFADEGIPFLGATIGGKWLGDLLSLGGMASMAGIFIAVLLSVSRVPAVMARDRLMPASLARIHSRYQTPYVSILICAGVVSLLVLRPLSDLLVIDISLYGAGIVLEFIALVRLRRLLPDAPRKFKIPLGKNGLIGLFIPPLLVLTIALSGALLDSGKGFLPALFAIGAILTALPAWWVARYIRKKYEPADAGSAH